MLAEIDELGNRTQYQYNALGQLTKVTYPEIEGNSSSISYEYDSAGRRIKETDALGNTVEYKYDKLGWVTQIIFADETSKKNKYDSLGNKVETIDQNGIITRYKYDNLGRLTTILQTEEGQEVKTSYTYNEIGQLVRVTDAENRITKYEYDSLGRRIAVELPGSERTENVYDAVGNIISERDFNGNTIAYQRNTDIPEEDIDVKYTYTPTGKIESILDSRGLTIYKYDGLDRLISRTDPNGPYNANTGTSIEYKYDLAGNIILVRTPGGRVEYEYDELNRLEKVIDSGEETTYDYDVVGNLIKTTLPNGITETREYDNLNRLILIKTTQLDSNTNQESVISSFEYTLDKAGNRIKVTESDNRAVEYEYDELYRLTEERLLDENGSLERTIKYSYDETGNRLSREDSLEGKTYYIYDENERLKKTETWQDNQIISTHLYSYDRNGNLTGSVKDNEEEIIYSWDIKNRLIGVDNILTGDSISYEYDTDGIRVSATVNEETTNYLVDKNWDFARVLEEQNAGTITTSYTHGLDLLTRESNGKSSFYHVDGLGSTRNLTDSSGTVTDTYRYDAYGNLLQHQGSSNNPYLFAGEQYDSALESYYLRARYYDPNLGRFNTRDPFEGWMREPLSLAKYTYVHGNPVNAIDPSGLSYLNIASGVFFSILKTLSSKPLLAGVTLAGVYYIVTEAEPPSPIPFPFPAPPPEYPDIEVFPNFDDDFSPFPAPPEPYPELPEMEFFPDYRLGLKELIESYIFRSTGEINVDLQPAWETWSEEQRTMAQNKIDAINKALSVNPATVEFNGRRVKDKIKGDPNVKKQFKKQYEEQHGEDSWPVDANGKPYDVDHIVDLQYGGEDVTTNMQPLDKSVNRSLGTKTHSALYNSSQQQNPVTVTKINIKY